MVTGLGSYAFAQVDVFSVRPGSGNPLAVVLDARGLDSGQMQAIAAWTNLAETTFVLPPSSAAADYRVRIFTTRQEIAFAGHPSIGTAYALLAGGHIRADAAELRQECLAGILPLRRVLLEGRQTLSVRVPRSRIAGHTDEGYALLHRALTGCALGPLPPALVEGGRRWWLAELADEAAVRTMTPDLAAISTLARQTQSLGLCVFARANHGLVVRAFPLGVGIDEDPASGAANAAIAAFLDEANALAELGNAYKVSQGREMQRDAQLLLSIDGERQVWVGGGCDILVSGELNW